MAQRNLTAQFKALRDGFNARRRPRRQVYGNNRMDLESQFQNLPLQPIGSDLEGNFGLGNNSLNASLPPYWVDSVDEIKRLTNDIKKDITKLEQIHKNRLLVRFDNSESVQDREIDLLTQQITEKFREAERQIKTKIIQQSYESNSSSQKDKVIKNNIKRQLAQDLQSLSVSFRKSQKLYMDQLRAQKSDGQDMNEILGLTGSSAKLGRFESGQVGGESVALLSGQQQMTILAENDFDQSILDRDVEIRKIAENINELATIFKDLATLVIDQGTILDRIDYNLENVQIKTEKGLSELVKADKYAQNSRPFKCIMILVGIIVLEAVILVLKHT